MKTVNKIVCTRNDDGSVTLEIYKDEELVCQYEDPFAIEATLYSTNFWIQCGKWLAFGENEDLEVLKTGSFDDREGMLTSIKHKLREALSALNDLMEME